MNLRPPNLIWDRLPPTCMALAGLFFLCAGCAAGPATTPRRTFDVARFGAAGDGTANDAPAIQRAIDAAAGGGQVVLAPGKTYRCGALRLRDRVELHLEPGSRLLASDRREDYPEGATGTLALIEAADAEGVSLTGGGIVDGAARRFMAEEGPHMYRPGPWRPGLVHWTRCRDARVAGVTFRDSPHWCLHLQACAGVGVEAVTIANDRRVPNADGIDIDGCRDVTVRHCRVSAGDDAIVLKTTGRGGRDGGAPSTGPTMPPECSHVRVEACDVSSDSCALKIGTETRADVRDVVFDRCTIRDSNRGIGIALRDAGDVRDVTFSNITIETRRVHPEWWGRGEAVYLTALPRKAWAKVGRLSDVRVVNVRCRGEGGVYVSGSAASRPGNLVFEGVRVVLVRSSGYPVDEADLRPTDGTGLEPHPAAGFYFRSADGVTLKCCSVRRGRGAEAFGPALECHDVRDLTEDRFVGPPARPGATERVID